MGEKLQEYIRESKALLKSVWNMVCVILVLYAILFSCERACVNENRFDHLKEINRLDSIDNENNKRQY